MNYSNQHQYNSQALAGIHADMRAQTTNDRLEQLLKQAVANAEEQAKATEAAHRQTRHAIAAAWTGVGVAFIVGVTTILVTIAG